MKNIMSLLREWLRFLRWSAQYGPAFILMVFFMVILILEIITSVRVTG